MAYPDLVIFRNHNRPDEAPGGLVNSCVRSAPAELATCFEAGDVVVLLGEPDSLAAAEIRLLRG